MRVFVTLICLLSLTSTAFAHPGEGFFVTIDDETEAPRGLMELRVNEAGELTGRVRGSYLESEDMLNICELCEGELKDQPAYGLPILGGLEPDGPRKFKSGYIVDPESGARYKAKVKFDEDFQSLEMRGYVGTPLLGRTQVWRRASSEEVSAMSRAVEALGLAPLAHEKEK